MHLSASDIQKIGRQQGLTKQGLQFVLRAISSEPSRAVENRAFTNVISDFPSISMGETRQSESKSVERLGHLEREFDPSKYILWVDQVEPVSIDGHRKNGTRHRHEYRADVLDIERDGIFVTQYKKEAELASLCKANPKDWVKTGTGYEFVPANRAFESMGLIHRVTSSDNLSQSRGENIQLLLQAQRAPVSTRHRQLWKHAVRHLKKNKILRLNDLMSKMRISDATPLLQFIAEKRLFTAMSMCRLSKAESAWVALKVEDLREIKDALQKIQSSIKEVISTDNFPSPEKIPQILECLSQLEGTTAKLRSERTLRRYRKRIRESGSILGLKKEYRGRTETRLSPKHECLIKRVFTGHYAKAGRPSFTSSYKVYTKRHRAASRKNVAAYGRYPVSIDTFRLRYRAMKSGAERARGGRRAEIAASAPTDPDTRTLPASRAFQLAHLDHCLIKLFIIAKKSNGETYSKRAWLTFLVDDCTSNILASVLTFRNPSRRTCSRVLRDCVRRHGRLPEGIMTDAGVEFRSNFYRELLAATIIERFQRPVSAGRWGSVVERSFGHYKSVIDGVPGQMTDGLAKSRSVSSSHKAARIAVLDFYQANQRIEKFIEWFNNHSHGSDLESPKIAFKQSIKLYSCSGVTTPLDFEFRIQTSVPANSKEYKVSPTRGIHVQDHHYWNSNLAGFQKWSISGVRIDPEDDSIVYYQSNGKWRVAKSREFTDRIGVDPQRVMCETVKRHEAHEVHKDAKLDRDIEMGRILDQKIQHRSKPIPKGSRKAAKKNSAPIKIKYARRRKAIRRNIRPLELIRR